MENFYNLKLNEKLYLLSILIEDFNDGFVYKKNIYKASSINFNNALDVSKFLYIFSNFIVNKKSYNIGIKLKENINNKKVEVIYCYFKNLNVQEKLNYISCIAKYVSQNQELKKLGFINKISENYDFLSLSNDVKHLLKSLT